MSPFKHSIVVAACLVMGCTASSGASRSPKSAPGPNAETQRVTFRLIEATALCVGAYRPPTPGKIVIGAEFQAPGTPIQVFDSASSPGNEQAIACAISQGGKLPSPSSPPSPFVRFVIVIPGGPEDIVIDFPKTSPPRRPS
jgi:hypothetical protein